MEVVLGAHCVHSTEYGSGPAKGVPGVMPALHKKFPGQYVAGHLLNDNMGGSGKVAKNLTPLTQTANKNHAKQVEGPIKDALEVAARRFRDNPTDTHHYAIKYSVNLLDGKMSQMDVANPGAAPDLDLDMVPRGITCSAWAYKVPKAGGDPVPVSLSDRQKFPFKDFEDREILNTFTPKKPTAAKKRRRDDDEEPAAKAPVKKAKGK